jgi:hypothetical protein
MVFRVVILEAERMRIDLSFVIPAERNDKACALCKKRRVKSKGAPGLAFETWDPSNRFLLETLILAVSLGPYPDFNKLPPQKANRSVNLDKSDAKWLRRILNRRDCTDRPRDKLSFFQKPLELPVQGL